MQVPPQITFRNLDRSEAVEAQILERLAELERFYPRIVACRIAVERLSRRHHKGHIYHVRVDLTVPGKELVAGREPPEDHAHEDVYAAVRDSFHAARRQLEDYVRLQRGD